MMPTLEVHSFEVKKSIQICCILLAALIAYNSLAAFAAASSKQLLYFELDLNESESPENESNEDTKGKDILEDVILSQSPKLLVKVALSNAQRNCMEKWDSLPYLEVGLQPPELT